jgi:tetratricopeptide (TPR) repeat protein
MRRAVLADAASRPRRAAGSVGRLRRVLVLLLLLTPQLPTSLPASSPVTTMRAEVTRCEREAGPDSVETAVALARLAMQLWQRHELDEADSTAARAQALFERLFGAESLRVADALNIRGAVAFARNDVRAATEAWEAALRIRERELGGESPEVAAVLNNLASAKSALGELEAARALLARALDVSDRSVGPTHASSLSFRVTLTSVLHREGRLEEARRLCEQTLRLLADAPGADRLTEPHTHFKPGRDPALRERPLRGQGPLRPRVPRPERGARPHAPEHAAGAPLVDRMPYHHRREAGRNAADPPRARGAPRGGQGDEPGCGVGCT